MKSILYKSYLVHLLKSSLNFVLGQFDVIFVSVVTRSDFIKTAEQKWVLGDTLNGNLEKKKKYQNCDWVENRASF